MVKEYDFGSGQAVLAFGKGREERIPLGDVVTSVTDQPFGTPVLVDGVIEGHVLMATDHWSLVQLTSSLIPIAVSPGRVSLAGH